MNLNAFTSLLLLPVIYAEIDIIINVSDIPNKHGINTYGEISNVVEDNDRQAFKLHDEGLKHALTELFGIKPDDAYMSSPTPWKDLYKVYSWPEVKIIIKVQKAAIINTSNQTSIVLRETYSNNNTKHNATVNVNLNSQVNNTMKVRWKVAPLLSTTDEIRHRLNIHVGDNSTYEMNFAEKFGEDAIKSQHINIGTRGFIAVELEANQTVHVELHVTKVHMAADVDFKARIYGGVIANFENKIRDHHFHLIPVETVLDATGLKSSLMFKEYIELYCYVRCRLEIKDSETNELLKTIDLIVC